MFVSIQCRLSTNEGDVLFVNDEFALEFQGSIEKVGGSGMGACKEVDCGCISSAAYRSALVKGCPGCWKSQTAQPGYQMINCLRLAQDASNNCLFSEHCRYDGLFRDCAPDRGRWSVKMLPPSGEEWRVIVPPKRVANALAMGRRKLADIALASEVLSIASGSNI